MGERFRMHKRCMSVRRQIRDTLEALDGAITLKECSLTHLKVLLDDCDALLEALPADTPRAAFLATVEEVLLREGVISPEGEEQASSLPLHPLVHLQDDLAAHVKLLLVQLGHVERRSDTKRHRVEQSPSNAAPSRTATTEAQSRPVSAASEEALGPGPASASIAGGNPVLSASLARLHHAAAKMNQPGATSQAKPKATRKKAMSREVGNPSEMRFPDRHTYRSDQQWERLCKLWSPTGALRTKNRWCHHCKTKRGDVVVCNAGAPPNGISEAEESFARSKGNYADLAPGTRTIRRCARSFCRQCLRESYEADAILIEAQLPIWECPFCRGICTCDSCREPVDGASGIAPPRAMA